MLSLGWEGGIGEHLGYILFVFMAAGSLFMASMLAFFRDADPNVVAQLEGLETAPVSENPANRNFWPMAMAFGMIVMVVGLITHAAIFVIGIILAAASILEWTIFAWSERLTGDPVVNRQIRSRVMAPVEIPVLGAAIVAILALGASRVFLTVSELNAVWVGSGIAVVIFGGAAAFAARPKISKPVIASLLVVAALGVIAAGIASAAIGSREIHHEEIQESENAAGVEESGADGDTGAGAESGE